MPKRHKSDADRPAHPTPPARSKRRPVSERAMHVAGLRLLVFAVVAIAVVFLAVQLLSSR